MTLLTSKRGPCGARPTCAPRSGDRLTGGAILALVEADTVAFGVLNKRHPTNGGFNRIEKHGHLATAALADGGVDVGHSQRNGGRSLPIPIRLLAGPIQAESHRMGLELGPEIVPFAAGLKSKEALIKGPGFSHVLCAIHHEINGADGDWRRSPDGFCPEALP